MRGCQLCRQAGGGVALGYLRRCILSRFCELLCCFVGQLAACVFLSAETTIILYDRPNGDGSEEGANFADRRAGGAALGYLRRCILSRFGELLCCSFGHSG